MIKTLIINPNSDDSMTESIRELVEEFKPEYIEINVIGMKDTPKFIDSMDTIAQTYEETLKTIKSLEDEYEIFILACHLDPNLAELRKQTDKIIIGICESSLLYSQMLGKRFSIIGSSDKTVKLKTNLANTYGASSDLDYVGYPDDLIKGELKDRLLSASKFAKEKYNSDAIVLGCAGFVGIDSFIEKSLGMEVIDGVYTALLIADGYSKYYSYKNRE